MSDQMQKPRVTEILKSCGFVDSRFFNEAATSRGTAVHEACHLHDLGHLDPATLHPDLVGYLEAYKRFRTDFPMLQYSEMEARKEHRLFQGTPDRVFVVAGLPPAQRGVIDIKTGGPLKWHPLQLAAYAELVGALPSLCRDLYIRDDGTYKLSEPIGMEDIHAWRAVLNYYHAKEKYGIKSDDDRSA